MRAITRFFILSNILSYGLCWSTIINIPADYPTIQQGIDSSTDGDTVLVQPGTYYENINFNGHNIVLGSLFMTTGDTSYISQTAIDGDSIYTFGPLVSFSSGEDSTAIITGFSIQNNYGIGWVGGINCDSSSPSIRYNIIRDNYVYGRAGGIECGNYSNPIISNNIIIDNVSTETYTAGGIHCGGHSNPIIVENIISGNSGDMCGGIGCFGYSNAKIINNKIIDNFTFMFGGGISCSGSNAVVSGNEIINNRALYYGGGIYCSDSSQLIISNNTIAGNRAYGRGGGIYCLRADPLIINNSLFGNIADSVGGGLFCWESSPQLINNIFRADSIGWPSPNEANEIHVDNGSPAVEYCNIQGGWPGTGNIDIDPLFRDPVNSDFHLMSIACGDYSDSPCIDAGSPYYSDSLLDCSWGLGTTACDMGAFGGGDSLITTIFENHYTAPGRFTLVKNYPNPFNAQTTIEFTLGTLSDVELTIYDITGAKVMAIKRPGLDAGQHSIVWDAGDVVSGIYFARIEAADYSSSIKMVLLK